MSPILGDFVPERPLLVGPVRSPNQIRPTGRGNPKVTLPGPGRQGQRLDSRFESAMRLFEEQVDLSGSVQAADPQLVLVLEALDERTDLAGVAERLNIEILVETETTSEPDDDFKLISENPHERVITSCLHAVCLNQAAMTELRSLWTAWKRDGRLRRNYGQLAELFAHLKDLRPWGPEDRLKTFDIEARLAGLLPSARQVIELELWYRRTEQARQAAEQNVASLVSAAGGRVLMRAIIEDIGYHALKCDVPVALLQQLARGDFAQVQLVRSPDVIYLRVAGQALLPLQQETDSAPLDGNAPLPSGTPVVCLLDGVPVSNHQLLANRVIIYDPDDLSDDMEATGTLRKHGTAMASAIVWGDRSSAELPTARPLLVRPILTPSSGTANQAEEIADNQLTPDLMRRVFRELFEGDGDSAPVGSDVVIVNLSVADSATPFDTILSSWARMLDWLSDKYGVLVIVSAGNHCHLPTSPTDPATIASLTGEQRRAAINQAMSDHQADRRLLSPAESINAVTVGALHSDAASGSPLGYRFDPSGGLPMASPITSLGSGYRRSVKPELVAPGGRAYFGTPIATDQVLALRESTVRGPGILVASPTLGREVFTLGTSPAAALTTRRAADLYEAINSIAGTNSLTRRHRAVGIKALLIHGARFPEGVETAPLPRERVLGYGAVARDFTRGCENNEVVVLYFGNVGAAEEQELLLPLPAGLQSKDAKRITATLAWLSPVNWRHRQYRRASLDFTAPTGFTKFDAASDLSDGVAKRGAGTAKHLVWDTTKTVPHGHGDTLTLKVKCLEQAGGLRGDRVDYAVALSVWVAPTVGIDIYSQVRDQIRARVPVQPQ